MSAESSKLRLFEAVSFGNLEEVKDCISNNTDLNATHKIGEVEAFPL